MRKLPGRSSGARTARKIWLRRSAIALVAGATTLGCAIPVALAEEGAAASPATEPAASPASAQGAGTAQNPPATSVAENQPEEIVVTSRKRSETLHDIPASIQAISDKTIQEAHITQLEDIGSMVPNLNMFNAHDNSPAVTMRGIGAFELVQGVGFFSDDVQLYEGQTVRPNDIQRIEVLKGPQGTLYGGANIGGAVKYVTKDPTPTWENEATFEVGQYWTRNVGAVLSGPLTSGLGIRASVYDDNQDGYIFDTYHQKTIGASYDRGARLVLLAEPSGGTSARLVFNYDDYDSQNQNLQYRDTGVFYRTQPYTADAYRYSVDDYFIPSFTRKIFSSTLQIDHRLTEDIALTGITAQFWSLNRGITDFTKQPVPLDKLFQNLDQRILSQELRLASASHSNLDWLVGAFVQQHKSYVTNSDITYAGDPTNPVGIGYDFDNQDKTQRQYALFGDVTYYWRNWQYELGLRTETYSSKLNAANNPGTAPMTPTVFLGPESLTGHEWSPRVSVQYKVSAATNVYGTFARGFEPADEVEQNLQITQIRPETASSFELGVKSRLPHGAQINAAVYYMLYHDRLYQTFKDIPGGFQDITTNIGPSRNSGFEMDFLLPLSPELKLNGGFGTTRAVWEDVRYGNPQLTQLAGGVKPVFTNLNGLTAPFTPAYSANLALDWNHQLNQGYAVGARVDGSAIGQSYWDPNDFARQKAYQIVNAGAHIDAPQWTLIARVTNLSGTRYNTMYWDSFDVGGTPNSPPFHSFARINRPRTFTVSGTYRF
jgi:iron complex outermembrane receptor protein